MAFVLDASMAIAWLIPEDGSAAAEQVFGRLEAQRAIAPSVWWFEVRNVLMTAERKGRITPAATDVALARLSRLGIEVDPAINEARLFGLARDHRLTVYDAAYLALAEHRALPLATLDRALLRAAAAIGIAAL